MTITPEPVWLNRNVIEALQTDQIREHGGRLGLRDPGLLESALARPRHMWSYEPDADLAALAAEYGYGLAKNHAFLDGNKRIAFIAMNVFLILNGFEIDGSETAVVETMIRVAAEHTSSAELAAWVRGALVPYPS